ncbi:hypothetical protein [Salimicrobium halophilum]|uniref:Uncharacterized protein n=1 Tax=Salimicrobium halophilum TaxID=86666 RepID=A0A1G8R7F0_9BACI|nr:hypothetical protein [Salimicrobium halophilum]SDJ12901.1 hypothetical protein SAMN04490247_0875 [Salimicrobium halophilum]
MNKWKVATFILLAVSITLGIFTFQAEKETRAMEKDLVLHYKFNHHKMTEMLGRAIDSYGDAAQVDDNLHYTYSFLEKVNKVTANASPIGRHAELPINFDIYHGTPVLQAYKEINSDGALTEETKKELTSFYDRVSAIDEKLQDLDIEDAGAEELREELARINEELELGSPV